MPTPDQSLWLNRVGLKAAELRAALKGANNLPDDFPRGEFDAVCAVLEFVPKMTEDGAVAALLYARSKLADLRGRSIPIDDAGSNSPEPVVDDLLDQRISSLISDVGTALEQFPEPAQSRADNSRIDPRLTATGRTPALKRLATRAGRIADGSGETANAFDKDHASGMVDGGDAGRRARDIEGTARNAQTEAGSRRPRLRRLELLQNSMKYLAPAAIKALQGIRFTSKAALYVHEKWEALVSRTLVVWNDEIDKTTRELEALIQAHLLPPGPPPGVQEWPDLHVFSDRLKDGSDGPSMVVLPSGSFLMGSPESDKEAHSNEKPQRLVTIDRRFALGRYPVTFEEYDRFCAAMKREPPSDEKWGRGRRPAINVSWEDATAYCAWLSGETGANYRLPSEAEWEYACRAKTATRYWWGDAWEAKRANGGRGTKRTTEVGDYPANPWKLADVLGNVWEWCMDHYEKDVAKLPVDGSVHLVDGGRAIAPWWCGAVPGTAGRGTCAAPTASGSRPSTGAAMPASVSPGRFDLLGL